MNSVLRSFILRSAIAVLYENLACEQALGGGGG